MPRVTDTYRRRRQDEIAAAAARVIDRRGFGATTMSDVIAESGLSPTAVYHHFATKRDVFLHASRSLAQVRNAGARAFQEACIARMEAGERLSPRDLLSIFLDAMAARLVEQPTTLHVHLYSQALVDAEFAEVVSDFAATLHDVLADLLRRNAIASGVGDARAAEVAEDLAPVMVTLVQGSVLHVATGRSVDVATLHRRLTAALPDAYAHRR